MLVKRLDNAIYGCLLLYALASSLSIAVANIAITLALLLAIVRYVKEPVRFMVDRRLVYVMIFFGLTVFASAMVAPDRLVALNKVWAYVYRSLPFFLVAAFLPRKRMVPVFCLLAVSILIADLVAIGQTLKGMKRAEGLASHTMILAGYLIQMLPFLAVLSREDRSLPPKVRLFLGITAIFCIPALIFNQTRGAWLAVGAIVLIYGLARLRKMNAKVVAIALIVAAVAVGISLAFVPPQFQQRAMDTANLSAEGPQHERLLLWRAAIRMAADHPLLGVGTGNFQSVYLASYLSPESRDKLGHAHNNFLHILAENGIVGLTGFVTMFGYFLVYLGKRGIGRAEPVAMAVFLATTALLLQGLSEFNYGDSAVIRMYWFLLGLAAVASAENEQLGRRGSRTIGPHA